MPSGIGALVRGFWQAAKKLGRAWTAARAAFGPSFFSPNDIRGNYQEELGNYQEELGNYQVELGNSQEELGNSQEERGNYQEERGNYQEERGNLQEQTRRLEAYAAGLCGEMGEEAYYRLAPIYTEMPFIRPMGHNTQLPNTIRYIDMNPQRLATKRLKPGFFRVQRGITVAGRSYDGVGNATLLMFDNFEPVHVRSWMVKAAQRGQNEKLRKYMNDCVLKARQGVVMVSPFISPEEKQVMQVLLREEHPFIVLADNGFRDYYKPIDCLFDGCAAGRVLILSPWPYDAGKRHISREECVALNAMAEKICRQI